MDVTTKELAIADEICDVKCDVCGKYGGNIVRVSHILASNRPQLVPQGLEVKELYTAIERAVDRIRAMGGTAPMATREVFAKLKGML